MKSESSTSKVITSDLEHQVEQHECPKPEISLVGPRRVVMNEELVAQVKRSRRKVAIRSVLAGLVVIFPIPNADPTLAWLLFMGLTSYASDVWFENFRLLRKARAAQAKLLSWHATQGRIQAKPRTGNGTLRCIQIEYLDQNGSVYTADKAISTPNMASYALGNQATVVFNPSSPSQSELLCNLLEYVHIEERR